LSKYRQLAAIAALATVLWRHGEEKRMNRNRILVICTLTFAQTVWAQAATPPATAASAAAAAVSASKAAVVAAAAAASAADAASKAAADATAAATTAADAATAPQGIRFVTDKATDKDNFLGDRIDFYAALKAKQISLGGAQPTAMPGEVCVPPESWQRGIGKVTLKVDGVDVEHDVFVITKVGSTENFCESDQVTLGATIALPSKLLSSVPPNRYGWSFGTLFVPYKYQLRGDRSTSGGATLGGYVGYRATIKGTALQAIVFAGGTKVEVAKLTPGTPATATTPAVEPKSELESLAGLSYGTGVVGAIKESFKWGLVFGFDRVSRSVSYVNNGKMWVSLSLGFEFF
jgi:hypothetical protein